MRLLLVKERIVSVLTLQERWFWCRGSAWRWKRELAKSLVVTQQAISKRLKAVGLIQKRGNWVPYELKPRGVKRRFFACEQLLQSQNRKGFLHRIVTADEKWVHYDNPKCRKCSATFVLIDGPGPGSLKFSLLSRSQKIIISDNINLLNNVQSKNERCMLKWYMIRSKPLHWTKIHVRIP